MGTGILGHLEYPFPQMSICLGAHLHQCPFPRCPIFPNIYFPLIPFPQTFLFPSANLPQVQIYTSVPICPGAHMLRCPFPSNVHLPQVSIYSKFTSSSGCTSHLVAPLHTQQGAIFWFDPASICAGPICLGPNGQESICPGVHLHGTHLFGT